MKAGCKLGAGFSIVFLLNSLLWCDLFLLVASHICIAISALELSFIVVSPSLGLEIRRETACNELLLL